MKLQVDLFPFLKTLEDDWQIILEELNVVLYNEVESNKSYFIPWHETDIYRGNWDVYSFYSFKNKIDSNCKFCPKTTELIEKIPGLISAGFSSLGMNTHIKPHVGDDDKILRCHLGLIGPNLHRPEKIKNPWLRVGIPPENMLPPCGLRVDDHILQWEPGKAFVFDDTYEHEAWNYGERTRFILSVDFKKEAFPELFEGGTAP
jgi:beta-hydroxylase